MATKDLSSIRKQCVESINRCTDYVLKYLDGDDKDIKITELKSYIQGYCSLDEVLTSEDFKDSICEGDSVDDIIDKIAALPPNSKHNNHDYMKAFLEKFENQNSSEDDSDLTIISASQSLLDPITKEKIRIPMKNTVCGHLYDKKSILNHITLKRKVKCPYVGCSNMKLFSKSCLEMVPYDISVERNSTPTNIDSPIDISDDDDDEDIMEII